MKAYFGRRYMLSASHRLHAEALSAAENCATYGKCNNPHGHGHNYIVEVLVAGPIEGWGDHFARIAEMGFSHVCLAPPFDPGANGDIFVHATFDRLHPALGFDGPAERGMELAADLARRTAQRSGRRSCIAGAFSRSSSASRTCSGASRSRSGRRSSWARCWRSARTRCTRSSRPR